MDNNKIDKFTFYELYADIMLMKRIRGKVKQRNAS